jgi:hypothetical protein
MSDTTKIIPPPRRGPRWIDLILAALAGGLLTLLLIGVILGGGLSRLNGASASPSPSPSPSAASPSPSATVQIRTAAPTTAAPTQTTSTPGTVAPTATQSTPQPTTTPPRTNTPAPTRTP